MQSAVCYQRFQGIWSIWEYRNQCYSVANAKTSWALPRCSQSKDALSWLHSATRCSKGQAASAVPAFTNIILVTIGPRLHVLHCPHSMLVVVLQILPMENVNGRDKVEAGALCERKNGRGVDTNRNWDIDWGKKEKDYNPDEEFPGKAPHSEPEVKILHDLAKEIRPHVWLNVHSGMYALFTPYDHKPVLPTTTEAKAAIRILSVINQEACKGRCVVGSGGSSVG